MGSPLIWKGNDAQLLVAGTILKKDGTPLISGGGAGYPVVETFAALPDPVAHSGEVYIVKNSSGVWLISRKLAGFYISNGSAWTYIGDSPATTSIKVGATNVVATPVEFAPGANIVLTPDDVAGKVTVAVSGLATVATSGAYSDLSGKPTIPAAQVNSDWNAGSGVSQILNKPTIPAAQVNSDWNAGSGVAQILNKPTLGTAAAQDWANQNYPDGVTAFQIVDDFFCCRPDASNVRIFGQQPWALYMLGSASFNIGSATLLDPAHPGILELHTGAASNGVFGMFIGNDGLQTFSPISLAAGKMVCEWWVNIPAMDATNDYIFKCGLNFSVNPAINASNAIVFYANRGTSDKWLTYTNKAGSSTVNYSTLAVTAGWHKLKIVLNDTGTQVDFYVDSTLIQSHTTNIPLGVQLGLFCGFNAAGTGTVDRVCAVDRVYFRHNVVR